MLVYAIGDVHGHLDKLMAVHRLIEEDRRRHGETAAPVVHLGDLVDRGPESAGVIDFLLAGLAEGRNWVVIRGNHDRMFLDFLGGGTLAGGWGAADWLRSSFGGTATLASYGIAAAGRRVEALRLEAAARVPRAHRDFLSGLPLWHRTAEAIFVHAGLRPGLPLELQTEEDLIWIRAPFLFDSSDHGALVVHGHTPVDEVTHYRNRLAVDTGAGHGRVLSAVAVEGRRAWLLTEAGRVPVEPF